MYIFFFLRCLLGLASTAAEVYLVSAVKRQLGPNVARITLAFLLCSAGMFAASTAFLPSSASMYLTMLMVGAWFRREYKLAILFTAMSTFLSWPFAALIGLPIAIDVLLVRKKLLLFIRWSLISVVTILLPQVAIDSMYYGKLVVAPLNIVKYNIFTDHGPDLYGKFPKAHAALDTP
jgi:alpha-1,2-mannosyltransferase